MICVVQRVSEAAVRVDGAVVGEIGRGLLVLAAVERSDTQEQIDWTARKLAGLRLFPTPSGDKNFELDVTQIGGAILLVSNFTVAAATAKGRRPSFDVAAPPEEGRRLFDALVDAVRGTGVPVATGRFGADMAVSLVNDGPVTVILQTPPNS